MKNCCFKTAANINAYAKSLMFLDLLYIFLYSQLIPSSSRIFLENQAVTEMIPQIISHLILLGLFTLTIYSAVLCQQQNQVCVSAVHQIGK